MTQNNICVLNEDESIALGDWPFDEHMTGKYAVPDGNGGHVVMLEGNYWPSIAQGCNNSASHYVRTCTSASAYICLNVPAWRRCFSLISRALCMPRRAWARRSTQKS